MKSIFTILLAMLLIATTGQAQTNTIPKPEDIYAGAVFCHNQTERCVDIILVETWNNRFFLGNSWSRPFALYSNFHGDGGSVDEVCAYLRGEGYYYVGRYQDLMQPIVITNTVTITNCPDAHPWILPGNSTDPMFPSNYWRPFTTGQIIYTDCMADHMPMMMSIDSNGNLKAIPNPHFIEPDLSCASKLTREEQENYWRTNSLPHEGAEGE